MATRKTYTAELMSLWLLVKARKGGDAAAAWPAPGVVARVLDQTDVGAQRPMATRLPARAAARSHVSPPLVCREQT
jgi:hypothetical protein